MNSVTAMIVVNKICDISYSYELALLRYLYYWGIFKASQYDTIFENNKSLMF